MNDRDGYENSMLHLALESKDEQTLCIVFEYAPSNVCRLNENKETPFDIAIKTKNMFAVQLFQNSITSDTVAQKTNKCLKNCNIDLKAIFFKKKIVTQIEWWKQDGFDHK